MNSHEKIIRDAASLSDGTLATLTGRRSFAELEQVQADFVAFVEKHPGQCETWMQAWDFFWGDGFLAPFHHVKKVKTSLCL